MKRIAAFTLLVASTLFWSIPSNAQDGVAEYARQSRQADKKARQISTKAARKQQKAMKKYLKAQRKTVKKANRRTR